MFRSFMVVMLLAGITTAARADDFDARWKAVSDGVATCWNFGKSHEDETVTYPEPYRAVCNQLAELQARMSRIYHGQQTRAWLDHLEYDLRKAEGK
jgi:hypothetical protein